MALVFETIHVWEFTHFGLSVHTQPCALFCISLFVFLRPCSMWMDYNNTALNDHDNADDDAGDDDTCRSANSRGSVALDGIGEV